MQRVQHKFWMKSTIIKKINTIVKPIDNLLHSESKMCEQ